MENSVDVFEPLMDKGGEYYLCASHLHFRGMSEIITECGPLVVDLISKGKTFEDLCKHFESLMGGAELVIESDKFLEQVKVLFENNKKG